MQSLTGFTAYAGSIGFLDVNFDGYYDVVLADTSDSRKVEDKRFIYWMYNPKTKQFQRSPQLEKIAGFPALHGEKQRDRFWKCPVVSSAKWPIEPYSRIRWNPV